MRHLFTLVALSAAAFAANAAESMGTLGKVEGAVTLGGSGLVTAARQGATLKAGDTITVSSTGKATVMLKDGCVVPLRGSQYLRLDATLTCSQLFASVVQLNNPYRQAAEGGTGSLIGGGTAAGGAGFIIPALVITAPLVGQRVDNGIDVSGN